MANYDIIEADNQVITLRDGETYANKLIDLTTGKDFTINARNKTNWTIRNIGIKGYFEGDGFIFGVSDTGGNTSLVENIYIADGASKANSTHPHGPGAFFLGREHTGHITFRNINVQGYPNNGFYCSNGTGTSRFENCYAKNNGITSYRTNTNDEIVNCVGYNDNTNYGWYHEQHNYVEENGRPVWAWSPGTLTITNSDFARGPYPQTLWADTGTTINFNSGTWDGGPNRADGTINIDATVTQPADLTMPAGVPTTPEAAAGDAPTSPTPIEPEPTPPDTEHEYETIVAQDQTIYVEDNQVFQNKLIDCTNGKSVRISAVGVSNFRIQNIGFLGQPEQVTGRANIHVGVADGSHGHIENVYLPGVTSEERKGAGIRIAREHAGTLTMKRLYVEDYGYAGVLGDKHGRPNLEGAGGGEVDLIESLFINNQAVNIALGGNDHVQDTTVLLTTLGAPKHGWGIYSGPSGPVSVDNCILAMNGKNYSFVAGGYEQPAAMSVTNTDYDTQFFGGVLERHGSSITFGAGNTTEPFADPDMEVGIPKSAEEAAGGLPFMGGDEPTHPPTPSERLEYPGAIGAVTGEFSNGIFPIPVYNPADVEWAAVKIQLSDPAVDPDDIGSLAIAPRADAAFPGISTETAGGIYSPTHLGEPRRVPIPGDPTDPTDPGSDPESVLIDNFDTGVSGAWDNNDDWESSSVETFRGARSARRLEGGLALQGGPGQFEEWVRPGGPFIRWAVRANTTADNTKIALEFARSRIPHETPKYSFQVDWSDNQFRINELSAAGAGTPLDTETPTTPGLNRFEWYDCVGHWAADGTLRFWIYTRDGTPVASLQAAAVGHTGDYFALNATRPTNIYADEVSFYETHPHTQEDSMATIGSGTYTAPQATTIDDFEYADLTTLDTYYNGNLSNFETTQDVASTGTTSTRLRTERYAGGELWSMPADGLPAYPEEGDTIRWRFRSNRSSETADGAVRHRFRFGRQSDDAYFDATLNVQTRRYFLAEKTPAIDRTPFSDVAPSAHVPANRWIRGELEWRPNRIRLRFLEDKTNEVIAPWIEGTPAYHNATGGGFAFVHYAQTAAEEVWTDSVEIAPTE